MASSLPGPELRVAVFGGLRLWRAGVDVDLGPNRQRTLLGILVAASGATVGVSEMVETLWPWGDPPASAVNQLHRMVGQLRRLLEPELSTRAPGRWLQSSGSGYRLVLDVDECDLPAFRRIVEAARTGAAAGRWRDCVQTLVGALDIAAAEPFSDLDEAVLVRAEFAQVRRERLDAVALALDAGLACGELGSVLGACERIAASAPLDEALQARLVRSLAGVGRRPAALELHERTRRGLAEELGIDPGPELGEALQEALEGATIVPPPPATSSPRPAVPRQLPPRVQGFVDRSGGAWIPSHRGEALGGAGTAAITAVGGMGGVGKTAFAVHWAHQLAPRFPDGQLYVNLRGFDPGGRVLSPSDALGLMLESLGVVLAGLGNEGVEARSARFRTLLAGRRMLLLLDNARDSAQVRPLLPSTETCLVLVTSRNQLAGLVAHEGATVIALDRLTSDDARRLLAARVGAARLAAEPAAVDALVDACAGLPLALSMVAAKAAVDPRRRLADLAQEIAVNRLDALITGETNDGVRATFHASYTTLSVDAARLFRLLAVHPGPEISLPSAVSLTGRDRAQVREDFSELQSVGMVAEPVMGRFVLHDLLRAYAGELLEGDERGRAEARLVQHYVGSTRAAWLSTGRPALVMLADPAEGVIPEAFTHMDQALAWYSKERAVLFATVHLAIACGMVAEAASLVLDWRPMNHVLDSPSDTLPLCLSTLAAARTLGDPLLEAELQRDVATKYSRIDRLADAEQHYGQALAGFEALGDLVGQANTLRNLSNNAIYAGHPQAAVVFSEQAVEAARPSGRSDTIALCLANYANALSTLGQYEPALVALGESLTLATAAGIDELVPVLRGTTADCLYRLGRFADAVTAAQFALEGGSGGDQGLLFTVLATLAAAALEEGDLALARDSVRQAEPMMADTSDWYGMPATDIDLLTARLRHVVVRLQEAELAES